MLKYFPAFSIILVLASLPVEIVLACSCAKGETERSRFDRADYIALVKITDAELRDASELGYDEDMGDEYIRISFNEIEVIKGASFSPKYLKEYPYGNGNCMPGLRPGLEYVIFMSKNTDGFVTICSGSIGFSYSAKAEEKSEKLKQLREWTKKEK